MKKQQILNIGSIYDEYLNTLYSYAIHLGFDEPTVMDAIHDIFYKLCIQHESLNNIANLKFYLLRSLRNRLIDIYRTNKLYSGLFTAQNDFEENMAFNLSVTIEDELIMAEDAEEIRKAVNNVLNRLSNRQREIIYLRYKQGYSYEEIAEIMQISVAACRNLISKSLIKLKESPLSKVLFLLFIT